MRFFCFPTKVEDSRQEERKAKKVGSFFFCFSFT